jgi:hypothetical protein
MLLWLRRWIHGDLWAANPWARVCDGRMHIRRIYRAPGHCVRRLPIVTDHRELTCKLRTLNIAAMGNWQIWSESASTLALQPNKLNVLIISSSKLEQKSKLSGVLVDHSGLPTASGTLGAGIVRHSYSPDNEWTSFVQSTYLWASISEPR